MIDLERKVKMKILKYGTRKIVTKFFILECPICGCEFEFEESEAAIAYAKNLSGGFDGEIDCPCCNHTMKFDESAKTRIETNEQTIIPNDCEEFKKLTELDISDFIKGPQSSNCSGCTSNKKSYEIGDSLCQWCQHSPTKLTCK